MKLSGKVCVTSLIVIAATGLLVAKYRNYALNPWTRDGKVRANVIQITPRVSGPITLLPVTDNQRVAKGDLLFAIDPRTFEAAYDQARANLDKTRDQIKNLAQQVKSAEAAVRQSVTGVQNAAYGVTSARANFEELERDLKRYETLAASGTIAKRDFDLTRVNYVTAQTNLNQAQAQVEKAYVAQARAQCEQARLNLEFATVKAPADGYVTNLNLRLGSQAVANQPLMALVDADSYWVAGYFRESSIAGVKSGDRATVTLMTYPDTPMTAVVESIGRGVAQQDGSTGQDLLPNVSPTFEWIRLAQRVPERVRIVDKPKDVELRVGATASVLVVTR